MIMPSNCRFMPNRWNSECNLVLNQEGGEYALEEFLFLFYDSLLCLQNMSETIKYEILLFRCKSRKLPFWVSRGWMLCGGAGGKVGKK